MPSMYLHPRRRRALLCWAISDTLLGIVLIVGGADRFSSPAWNTAKAIAPMRTWGLIAFGVGLVWLLIALCARHIPWPTAGYLIGVPAAILAGWHAFVWMALCFASIPHHRIALTGCVIYAGVAVNHVLFAVDQV